MKKMLLGLLVCNCMGLYAMGFMNRWPGRSQGWHSDRQTLGPLVDLPSSDSGELRFGQEFGGDRLAELLRFRLAELLGLASSRLHAKRLAQCDPVNDDMNYESDEEGDPLG